jgi:hypothetical protein
MKNNQEAMLHKSYTLLLVGMMSLFAYPLLAQSEKDLQKERNKNTNTARKPASKNLTETIVGTWQVDEIFKGKKDISNTDTLGFNETIIFDQEGNYVSHSSAEKIDSGLYRLNENHSILYLDSETGDNTTEWSITFSKGGMILQPRSTHPHAQSFKYTYTRATGN